MRRKQIAILLGALLLVACTLSLIGHLADGGAFTGSIGLRVLRYETTNLTTYTESMTRDNWDDVLTPTFWFTPSPPHSAAQVQTNAGVILARVQLRNTGTQPLAYQSANEAPVFTCRVQRAGEWACLRYRHFTAMTQFLGVGESLDFRVGLPPDTAAWRLQFRFGSAIPKRSKMEVIFGRAWWRLVPSPFLPGLGDGQSYTNIGSNVFVVEPIKTATRSTQ
jgi:hypothetical protein